MRPSSTPAQSMLRRRGPMRHAIRVRHTGYASIPHPPQRPKSVGDRLAHTTWRDGLKPTHPFHRKPV